jgi:hypothetical protein
MSASSSRPPTTDTFTGRYVHTGELRLHAIIGGHGPPLMLVHGAAHDTGSGS